jgi:twinkle protein
MQLTQDNSEFLRHEPCPNCGSSDALAVYGDQHTEDVHHSWCFSCQTYTKGEQLDGYTRPQLSKEVLSGLLTGEFNEIKSRGLTEETCRKFGYLTTQYNGEPVQAATYRDASGNMVAQKLRTRDKRFTMLGDAKAATLYGSHLWKNGKKLVITEGEIDAMTVSQVQGHKWATVSLVQGAASAVKAIKANWDYVNRFDEVILMFDMDAAGQKAAQEAAATLPVGKAKIAYLPCKDANQCLLEGKTEEIISAIFQAREHRPDGIVVATDYRDVIGEDDSASAVTFPYSILNDILMGLRPQEILTVAAGSGTGKTTFVKEIAYHLHQQGEQVGLIMLEESNKRTLLGLTGIHMNKNLTVDRSEVTDEEIVEAFDDLFGDGRNPVYLYDHWGSSDVDLICQRITYMAKALSIRWVVLDHISILCTQMGGNSGFGSERILIDYAMTKLRTMVQELGIGLILVSHVKRPDGNSGHESGGQPVRLNHLRGSSSLGQLSDGVIALNVDPDEPDSDIRHLHILKNRYTGATGFSGTLRYDRNTGRLIEEELSHLLEQEEEEQHDAASSE